MDFTTGVSQAAKVAAAREKPMNFKKSRRPVVEEVRESLPSISSTVSCWGNS